MYVAYYLSIGTFCLEAENADADSAYETPGDRIGGQLMNPGKAQIQEKTLWLIWCAQTR
jgi:hypothetical protein